jgi:predicted metal-dependent hydrolase
MAHLRLGLPTTPAKAQIRDAAQAWLMRQAQRAVFTERLDHFAPHRRGAYTRLRLSNAGTRWGSASVDGSIRLNWRLIHLAPELIDYVVVHELSHLRDMDHSPPSGTWWPACAARRRRAPQALKRRRAVWERSERFQALID